MIEIAFGSRSECLSPASNRVHGRLGLSPRFFQIASLDLVKRKRIWALSVPDSQVWNRGVAPHLVCVLLALSRNNSLPFCPFRNLLFPVTEDEKTRLTASELDVSVMRIRILHPRTTVHHVLRSVHEGNVRMTKD